MKRKFHSPMPNRPIPKRVKTKVMNRDLSFKPIFTPVKTVTRPLWWYWLRVLYGVCALNFLALIAWLAAQLYKWALAEFGPEVANGGVVVAGLLFLTLLGAVLWKWAAEEDHDVKPDVSRYD